MITRCRLGHPYDDNAYSECPYCKSAGGIDGGETVIVNTGEAKTKPLGRGHHECKTIIFNSNGKNSPEQKSSRADPVVGWLVCYEGVEKGKDYRIRFGQNSVGRDDNMDIVLKDESVSRNGHCFITYDHKHNVFVINSGISHGVTYKNGQLVAGASEIATFDELEIGNSKFLFVALCGENFKWEPSEK